MKIAITGAHGLVGSACVRHFTSLGYEVRTCPKDVDLRDQVHSEWWISCMADVDCIVHCAAKVGGVLANKTFPVEFLLDNLKMQNNVISNAHKYNINRLVFVGTSCLFPRNAALPVAEESLLTAPFEPSVEAYAIAKLAGWRLCKAYSEQYGRDYSTVNPSNIYGINDHYNADGAHVIPSLIRKFHEAKISGGDVTIWGDGQQVREFIFSDDVASAIDTVIHKWHKPDLINIGTGIGTAVWELVVLLAEITEFKGRIIYDTDKPTGLPKKTFDVTKIHSLGWTAQTTLSQGLRVAYNDFLSGKPRGT